MLRSLLLKLHRQISRHNPKLNTRLYGKLVDLDTRVDLVQHKVAQIFPDVIQPQPRSLFISLTSKCNFACKGCHYGRDFMPGHQLSLDVVLRLLDDAKAAGFSKIRFYGGEPLAHKDLPRMIAHAEKLGLMYWITSNGLLLKKRIDELFEAGARNITLGYYGGTPAAYDAYVQRTGAHQIVEDGIAYARKAYGTDLTLSLDWLLMRPTSSREAIAELWQFASRYRLPIHVNLVHYSLPYFQQLYGGRLDEETLWFSSKDRLRLEEIVDELISLREKDPELIPQLPVALRSIPDWLIKKQEMRVPCMSRRLIWVGPDGTVQMCYVTFKLGNLNESSLRDILFSLEHKQAARDAFHLNCPNCNCGYDKRVLAHGPSRSYYANI